MVFPSLAKRRSCSPWLLYVVVAIAVLPVKPKSGGCRSEYGDASGKVVTWEWLFPGAPSTFARLARRGSDMNKASIRLIRSSRPPMGLSLVLMNESIGLRNNSCETLSAYLFGRRFVRPG